MKKPERRKDPGLRAQVLKRDKCICQLCNKKHKARFLQMHHIIMWSKAVFLRFDIDNCITLCYQCHKSIKNKEHHYQDYFFGILNDQKKEKSRRNLGDS